jgi:glycosyltransferase involved in cell wall biosynthesis
MTMATPEAAGLPGVAVVAIGRNEGERLRACLHSVVQSAECVVYVDSGSTDGSVAMAEALGVHVVVLPRDVVFTAALARNAGWRRVLEIAPHIELVQFVDGDCAVDPGWLRTARDFLVARPDVAAVCGRRRERYPERSIYNQLCDLEWGAAAPGQTKACGGDVMMRAAPLAAVGGYNPRLIAGEEPELCVRLRAQGWKVWRLDAEMTLHDAAMLRIGQWWRRSMRAGYTFAEGVHLHGRPPERHRVVESRRAWIWGLVLPIAAVLGALLVSPWLLLVLLAYPLQVLRLYAGFRGPFRARAARAGFMVMGKFAEAAGQLKFLGLRLSGRTARLIEYK